MNPVGKAIMLIFCLMLGSGIIYLFITGEFADLKFMRAVSGETLESPLNTHDLGLFIAVTIIALPFILTPLLIAIRAYG